MLRFRGACALSSFRQAKLLESVKAVAPSVGQIHAEFAHFAEVDGSLAARELELLTLLLTYGPPPPAESPEGSVLLALPRFGTISPWSSKATDIAHNCGLHGVRRLERGVLFTLTRRGGGSLDAGELQAAAPLLFDRMTQTVVTDLDHAQQLFVRAEPTKAAPLFWP